MADEEVRAAHLEDVIEAARAALRRARENDAPPEVVARYEAEVERVERWISDPDALADPDEESTDTALLAWHESSSWKVGRKFVNEEGAEVGENDSGVEVGEADIEFPPFGKFLRDGRLADIGRKVDHANPGGRPSKAPPPAQLLEEMRAEQAKVSRRMSDTEAAGIVAERYDLSGQHVMRLTKDLRAE